MRLKELVVQGFKSFADKTVVSFGEDITAIVGPNGSGKSNISDAIRWVMGEQNSRSLRGQKMEDVIFGGTVKRAQLGFAEATLILDNTDRAIRFDADELMVTRRYYRSGESEYYINKHSVRLKDIHELFMDTGLGRDGYSNISQGRIDEILSLKSTDRREIFEEAAGISKYRHRKEETERRLATTEDNLLRIGDRISELELQVEPLREQAEKAKKYLAYREEYKGLEIALWLRSLEKLSATARKAEEDYRSAAFILQQEHDALDRLYVTSESLTFDLHNRDLAADSLREQIAAAEAVSQTMAGQIAVLRSNDENCLANLARAESELADQDSRSDGIGTQIASLQARMAEIDGESERLTALREETEAEREKLTDSAEGMTARFLAAQQKTESLREKLSEKQLALTALKSSMERREERRAQLLQDRSGAQSRQAEVNLRRDRSANALREAQEEVTAVQNTIAGYRLRQSTRAERRDALKKSLTESDVALKTLASRRKLFAEMQREYEGFSKAVRVVMQENGRALRGIEGPVSALIRTKDEFTVAIEIALGSAMQQIVVRDEQAAKAAIQHLKRTDSGRATFLPMTVIRGKRLDERGVENCRGFVGIASELVTCDDKYREIIANLLGKTVIVADLDAAIAIADRYGHRFRLVTLDGQVLNAGGAMTGGSVSRSAGILSRANELERLTAREKELTDKLSALRAELSEAERLTAEVTYELNVEEARLRTAQDETLRLEGEWKQHSALADAIADALEGTRRELALLETHAQEDDKQRDELTGQIAELERELAEAQALIATASDGRDAAQEQSARIGERLTELRMQLAALDAEKTTASDSVARLHELAEAMRGDRAQKQALLEGYRQEHARILSDIAAREAEREQHDAEVARRRDELKAALAERMQVEAKKTATEKDAQNKSRDILNMERESARLEAKKNAAEQEENQILDRLWESYELTRSTAPAEAAEIESVAAAQKRAGELKRKISALGTPNLGAIDEFARINERYTSLTEQRDDILNAKRDLETIIGDITKQMTEIFTTEFAKINRYFGETFVEMFGGGKGSLELEDPTQPLTCGIDIRVQPPGKQLKTITLLSGGEKAFVAIALYFAILKVRPTPFCMLDEIDAALDDRNVERFAGYLHGFSGKTQFIVITHRRGTMEAADVLYGVTMQEQGISKILHLDLNQMEQQLGIKAEE